MKYKGGIKVPDRVCPVCKTDQADLWFIWVFPSELASLGGVFEKATSSICRKDFSKIFYGGKIKNFVFRPSTPEGHINTLVEYANI